MSFPAYPEYKESGVQWLGYTPAHWSRKPLKHIAHFINGAAFQPHEWHDDGVPIIRIENLNESTSFNCYNGSVDPRYHVHPGDLLFGWSGNKGTSFGPFIWTRSGLHYLNQHIFKVTNFACHPTWLYWTLVAVTDAIEDEAHGIIGMVHITKSKLGSIQIPLIPYDEQTQIANFLDHETARIGALIEEQQRLIELLDEKRKAVISHAVTKGLKPDVPLKDSGSEWLGEVPAHWSVVPVRRIIYSIDQGWSPEASNTPADHGEWGVIKLSAVDRGRFWPSENKALNLTHENVYSLKIEKNDFLLTRANTPERVADVALVDEDPGNMVLCDLCYRLTLDSAKINKSFLRRFMCSQAARAQITSDARGTSGSMVKVSHDLLKAWVLPLPPLAEQREIASDINSKIASIDQAIDAAEAIIHYLTERRSALISAAATGKIDVRDWQPSLQPREHAAAN
jgi:type I restriction enzyme S subunit